MSDQDQNADSDNSQDAAQPEPSDSTDWKSEARKWEARAKSNRTEADAFKDLQAKYDEKSTQLTELLEKLSGYEAKEQRAELVGEVSKATGIPVEAVDSLSGNTLEDLTKQAEKIKPFMGGKRVVIPNIGDAPDKQITPESEFVGNLFGQGN